jgi:hypothetical protein
MLSPAAVANQAAMMLPRAFGLIGQVLHFQSGKQLAGGAAASFPHETVMPIVLRAMPRWPMLAGLACASLS